MKTDTFVSTGLQLQEREPQRSDGCAAENHE